MNKPSKPLEAMDQLDPDVLEAWKKVYPLIVSHLGIPNNEPAEPLTPPAKAAGGKERR